MAGLALPRLAGAHGGLPETSSVAVREGHPGDVLVGASFGAALTHDGGRTWRWVCPEVLGSGGSVPARFVWRAEGALLAATGTSLIRSHDGACSWEVHPGFADTWPTALAAHPATPARLFVATGRGGAVNGVRRSDDGGRTFSAVLAQPGLVFTSVEVAPGLPPRVYAAARVDAASGEARLFRSDDGGDSWSEQPQPVQTLGSGDLVLLAVSPTDADVLLARVGMGGYDRVVRSGDGGQSFTPVLELKDVPLGGDDGAVGPDRVVNAALSQDGQTAWVATYTGVHRSGDGGHTFTRLARPDGNGCVREVGGKLYACGSPWLRDWALATSEDRGDTWQPLFTFQDLQAVADCPAGSPTREVCGPSYPSLASLLLISPRPAPDAGSAPPPPPARGCAASGTSPLAPLLALAALRAGRAWLPAALTRRRRSPARR